MANTSRYSNSRLGRLLDLHGAGDVVAVPALRKHGARITIEFTIRPFRDKTGRTLGMAATLRDVTKRFEEIKTLREAVAGRS
jgi:PAS domain S-box-containing protein